MKRSYNFCAVCGARTENLLCECCRESFALCDMEDYLACRRAENCAAEASNAFKNAGFVVKYPKTTGNCGA